VVFHSDHKWNFGNCVVVCAAMLHQGRTFLKKVGLRLATLVERGEGRGRGLNEVRETGEASPSCLYGVQCWILIGCYDGRVFRRGQTGELWS
jgi:hypothetical protein